MLKEVGASGQISLGKKYAGQLFDLQTAADGSITMRPVKVVALTLTPTPTPTSTSTPTAQEERPPYTTTGVHMSASQARRAAAAARSPAEVESARNQWEEENKEAIEAMNKRMAKIGSMSRRIHEWRAENALQDQAGLPASTDQAA